MSADRRWPAAIPGSSILPALRMVPVTHEMKQAFAQSRLEFARRIGLPLPAGWPQFPEAFAPTPSKAATPPWSGYLFVSDGRFGSAARARARRGARKCAEDLAAEFACEEISIELPTAASDVRPAGAQLTLESTGFHAAGIRMLRRTTSALATSADC